MSTTTQNSLTQEIEEFLSRYYEKEIMELAKSYPQQRSLRIQFQDLNNYDPELANNLINKPDKTIKAAEKALTNMDQPIDKKLDEANVRFVELPNSEKVLARNIRSHHIGKFISMEGIIRKATEVRPKLTKAHFECLRCGHEQKIKQDGSDFKEPYECNGCERKGPFDLNEDKSDFMDSQKLQIQEVPEKLRGGEQPQDITIRVEDDITGEGVPGNRVVINGILRSYQKTNTKGKTNLFDVYIDCNSIEIKEQEFKEIEITEEEKEKIIELSENPEVYQKIINSIAPSIYGYKNVKEAMALQLFSGVPKKLPDGSRIRGDIHTLLVGDPGIGKSQILRYVANLAPRGVYASGKSSTSAGLCVSPNTLVPTTNGEFKIKKLVEDNLNNPTKVRRGFYKEDLESNMNLFSLSNGSIEKTELKSVWKIDAPNEVVKITTEEGKKIEVTPSTSLPVSRNEDVDWVKAGKLREGESIAIIKNEDGSKIGSSEDSRVFWDHIKDLEHKCPDYDFVYDVTVENHNFLANGLIVHNTAAAVRDEFGDGKWTLEAGALVLADKGIATIDEIDKMDSKDRSALHEAMEQQCISIAKAGITATLQSRCALLGAANPSYGRFDEYEPVAEQIDLKPTLLSRFDLIFTIKDEPDEDKDSRIAKHIITSHKTGEMSSKGDDVSGEESRGDIEPDIEPDMLRKYIAFSKRVTPVLTPGAKEKLKDFYLDLRVAGEEEESPVPVTARQLEALIRLAEASARTRLSDEITEVDANRAINIVRECLKEVGVDPETGEFDIDMLATGTSKSQRDKIRAIKEIIDENDRGKDGASREKVVQDAKDRGISEGDIEDILQKLRERGDIIEPKTGKTLRTT